LSRYATFFVRSLRLFNGNCQAFLVIHLGESVGGIIDGRRRMKKCKDNGELNQGGVIYLVE